MLLYHYYYYFWITWIYNIFVPKYAFDDLKIPPYNIFPIINTIECQTWYIFSMPLSIFSSKHAIFKDLLTFYFIFLLYFVFCILYL